MRKGSTPTRSRCGCGEGDRRIIHLIGTVLWGPLGGLITSRTPTFQPVTTPCTAFNWISPRGGGDRGGGMLPPPRPPHPLMAIFPRSSVPGFFTAPAVLSATQRLTNVVTCFIHPRWPLYLVWKQESPTPVISRQKVDGFDHLDVGGDGSAIPPPRIIWILSIASSATLLTSLSSSRARARSASIALGSPMYLSAPAA